MLVASGLPPVAALYHRTEFAFIPGVAVKVPVHQTEVLDAVGAAGTGFNVNVTAIRAAILSQEVVVL